METTSHRAPGKAHREGISLLELARIFPDERAAERWFEEARWGDEPCCPRCGGLEKVREIASRKPMKWHCGDCRRYFSVRLGTVLERSRIPLQKWAYAIYLWTTSLKGVSSMKLHRDLGISQKSAWFMAHRLREAYLNGGGMFDGPVEVDEMYVGGKRANMSNAKRKELREQGLGRGTAGKTAVVGMKDRETKRVVARVDRPDGRGDAAGVRGGAREPGGDALHGRCDGLQGDGAGARDGQALPPPSTSGTWRVARRSTRTASRACGRCSSGGSSAPTTG